MLTSKDAEKELLDDEPMRVGIGMGGAWSVCVYMLCRMRNDGGYECEWLWCVELESNVCMWVVVSMY